MKDFFHSIKFRILIGIAALLIGLLTYVAVAAGKESGPEQIINVITSPFVKMSNAISEGVNGFIDRWVNADTYKRENEQLKEQLTEMYKKTMDYDSVLDENERLREMLELKNEHVDYMFSEPCDIISRNANDMYHGFMINRGTNDGLSLNDPIMTTVGLVGRVTSIAPTYARVTTIMSPHVNVGVFSMRTKVTGVLENDVATAEKGLCLMSDILKDADISEGDVIFTSGMSGLFPEDVLVGTVVEVFDDPNGLSKHALVQPAVDFVNINTIMAITDFDGKGVIFSVDE